MTKLFLVTDGSSAVQVYLESWFGQNNEYDNSQAVTSEINAILAKKKKNCWFEFSINIQQMVRNRNL